MSFFLPRKKEKGEYIKTRTNASILHGHIHIREPCVLDSASVRRDDHLARLVKCVFLISQPTEDEG